MRRSFDAEGEFQVHGSVRQSNNLRDRAPGFKGGQKPDGADRPSVCIDLIGASLPEHSKGERPAMRRDLEMEAKPAVAESFTVGIPEGHDRPGAVVETGLSPGGVVA